MLPDEMSEAKIIGSNPKEYQMEPLGHRFPMPLDVAKNELLYNKLIKAKYTYLAACSQAEMNMYKEIIASMEQQLKL